MKLSKELLEKVISKKCSKQEINFLILVAQWQTNKGVIYNLHYKNITDVLNIAPKTFFCIMDNLVKKGIISVQGSDKYGFHHVTLLENNFSDKAYGHGYLNINKEFFYTKDFFDMKATAKYVVLKILLRSREKNYNTVDISNQTIAKYAGIDIKNKRLIKSIVNTIQGFEVANFNVFNVSDYIGKTKKKIHSFTLRITDRRRKKSQHILTENEVRQEFMFKAFCKKNRLPVTDTDIKDLVQMDNEYKRYSPIYIDVVKELLLQYKQKAKLEGSINFICAAIRSKIKPIIERMKLYAGNDIFPCEYLI